MTSRNDTSSVRAMMTVIALSALSLTTTFNTSGMIYNDSPLAIMGNISDNDMGTTTPSPQMTKTEVQTSYNFAKELFEKRYEGFYKRRSRNLQSIFEKIYKPTGVNIFDIC